MKKTLRVIIPLVLVLAIVLCTGWYLLVYDQEFTRDMLLHAARRFDAAGQHKTAAWFYNCAYQQAGDGDAVAIELAEQYRSDGNYTKAEYTLSNAIADGGGVEVYIALCKTYVEQDKLLDAVNMLNNVKNETIKAQLDMLRPSAPTCSPDPVVSGSYYSQYITVKVAAEKGTLYVSSNGEFPSIAKDRYSEGITLTDGENIIYAVAVSENGLVSPASIFGFTVGGVIEKVTFADAAVEQQVRTLLEKDAEAVLYTNDLWTIKEFTVPEGAADLSDLRHLAFVEKLTMEGSVAGQLSNIAALANLKELTVKNMVVNAEELPMIGRLPSLQKLTLDGCSLSTAAGLEWATELTYLNLSNNTIRNIAPLSSCVKLQQLNLSHNALNDLTALAGLTAMTQLDVSFNNITTLSSIGTMTGLTQLVVGNNALTEIAVVQQLPALTKLDLSCNSVSDITPLSVCKGLTDLNVSDNSLTDISILADLNALANLNFANNKVKELPKWSKDCALVNIDGSYNSLSTLEPLVGLKRLNNIFMDYNSGISSVKALASCPALIQVNVFGTGVTYVTPLTDQNIIVNYDPTK